jgi:hypothetical protein
LLFHIAFIFSISEIGKVRGNLFQINGKKQDPLVLPEGAGAPVTLSEKVYVPIKEYPEVSMIFFYLHSLKSLNLANFKLNCRFVKT